MLKKIWILHELKEWIAKKGNYFFLLTLLFTELLKLHSSTKQNLTLCEHYYYYLLCCFPPPFLSWCFNRSDRPQFRFINHLQRSRSSETFTCEPPINFKPSFKLPPLLWNTFFFGSNPVAYFTWLFTYKCACKPDRYVHFFRANEPCSGNKAIKINPILVCAVIWRI